MILKIFLSAILLLPTQGQPQPWCPKNRLCEPEEDKAKDNHFCLLACGRRKHKKDEHCLVSKWDKEGEKCELCMCPEVVGSGFCKKKNCEIKTPEPPEGTRWDFSKCGKRCRNWNGRKYYCESHRFRKKVPRRNNKCYLCVCPKPGVQCDPLFTGLRGQLFKFDGRNEAWYANIATKQLQWNIQFGQFSACPKDQDMFVTATSMLFFDNYLFKKAKPSHYIVIKTRSKNEHFPGCESDERVCLGNGSLIIEIDGHRITAPGDYSFTNGYGRVIAYNTFGACSHKWHDYRENKDETDSREGHARKLYLKRPIDYLIDNQENVLDPNRCSDWLLKRIKNDDIFDQEGNWATIHIETPLVSFHVEYRKNVNEKCKSHSMDTWITRTATELEEQKLHGILGETAELKFDSDGHEVISDRAKLLSATDDEAYEVDGEFGTTFKAQGYSW